MSGDTLTLAFPATAQFQLDLARDPKNATLLADALYDVTGRRLEVAFELGDAREAPLPAEEPAGEDEILGIFTDESRRPRAGELGQPCPPSTWSGLMQRPRRCRRRWRAMQDEAEQETAQSSVGGGLVKLTANGAGDVVAIEISPDAIDPEDPEALADLVLAGVNEALRSARAGVEAKAQQMLGDMGLGGLGLPGLGE